MAMQSIELNFDPTAYDTAQSELFTQLGKLQEARNEYDALKNQISQFWTGAEAESARETIQSNIKLVDQAYENVKKQQQHIGGRHIPADELRLCSNNRCRTSILIR